MHGGHHDIGGHPAGPVEPIEHQMAFWERRVEAMRDLLARLAKPLVRTDELRRLMEGMDKGDYDALTFYERKSHSLKEVLLEKNVFTPAELEDRVAAVERRRSVALRELPSRYDHRHEHDDVKDDDATPSRYDIISEAVHDLLIEKGHLSPETVSAMIERMENAGPANGTRIVARAWVDSCFRERLLADGKKAMAGIGVDSLESQIIVTENTPEVHNVIVCTLCSCYPRSVLGAPPAWYVSKPYRSRVIREPRAVLAEFGTHIPEGMELRVHDSTADMRYMVLPMRPEGTEHMDELGLTSLVSRDSLIGVRPADAPGTGRAHE